MPSESLSPALIQTLSQTSARAPAPTYYRSRLFTSSFNNNPLVAAAQPLLSLLDRLSISETLPPIEQLRNNIEHEILAFNSRIHNQFENSDASQMAHFMLCATIDEIIGKNYLRVYNKNIEFQSLSKNIPMGKNPQELFFELLDVVKQDPKRYLNILEFSYYCLISGLEGPYYNKPNGRQILDNLLDTLFQTISQHRTYRTKLQQTAPSPTPQTNTNVFNKKNLRWAGLLFIIGVIGGAHYYSLDAKVKSLRTASSAQWGNHLS